MNFKKAVCFFITFLFVLCSFYIHNLVPANAQDYENIGADYYIQKNDEHVDYLFTVKEVSSSKITDDSIAITSENLDNYFLENAKSLKSMYGYDVNYQDGELIVSGLIPDFMYDSLYVEAESFENEKYVLQIKNFKTAKSQDLIKQFITQTLQYTLKKSILPIEFYMWEHKILTKEVTPEEFISRVLHHPQVLYNIDTPENFINRIYSAIFLDNINEYELTNWIDKFNEYKQQCFMRDEEVYTLIIKEMLQSEEFKNRVALLNIDQLEIPLSTRYSEVYEDSKTDYKVDYEIENLYIMDYDELNRTEVTENSAVLFLNEGFHDVLSIYTKIYVDIENAIAKYENGKIIIEGLEPNTIYKNFKLTYRNKGRENIIFVERVRTTPSENQDLLDSNVVDRKFNILDNFGYSIDDFLKYFYEEKYGSEINENQLDYLRLLFVIDDIKFEKFSNLMYRLDFNIDDSIFVSKLYEFVFDRMPDTEGLDFWMKKFESYKGFMTNSHEIVKEVLLEMTESEEFKDRFNDVILRKIIELNNRDKKLHFV